MHKRVPHLERLERQKSPDEDLSRLILDIEKTKESIDDDEYAWRFAEYVIKNGGEGRLGVLARRLEKEIEKQMVNHMQGVWTKERARFSLETAVGRVLTTMTGSWVHAFLLSFVVVPPVQAIYHHVFGKQIEISAEGETLLERTKTVIKTSQQKSFSVNAYEHFSQACQLWLLLRVHKRVVGEFKNGERRILSTVTQ